MKTSTPNGTAAVVTMVLFVLTSAFFATADKLAARHGDTTDSPQKKGENSSDCTGPDLVITSVVPIKTTERGNKKYTVFIKNIGNAPAIMDYPKIAGWQAYFSRDGIKKDILVHGKNFSGTLGIGQTTSASSTISADRVSYPPHLIVELYVLSSVGECDSSNNTFIFSSRQQ